MIKEICVVGHPSFCGGADTELYDQIKCWHKMGIKIYICHTGPIYGQAKKLQPILEEKYNITYIKPRQWNRLRGFHCISFCNGEFLNNLKHIKRYAKSTTFVNCMTWNFKREIECQSQGLIDFHLYQTDHQLEKVRKGLDKFKDYKPIRFTPHFDVSRFPFHIKRNNDHFRFGRISRADAAKFAPDQFEIYDYMKSPVDKSGVVLGWNQLTEQKSRIQKSKIKKKQHNKQTVEFYKNYIQLMEEGTVSQEDFYNFCDVFIMSSDTFENLPRVGFECMSSGSVMIVNNRGGWKLQVENGKTGFLCDGTRDFIEKSTLVAKNPELKEQLRGSARIKLEAEWGIENAMKSWDQVFLELDKI